MRFQNISLLKKLTKEQKFCLYFGIIVYSVLLCMSVLFCKERIVMCDTSLQLFEMIKNDGFAIQVQRFGAGLTQIFPILGIWFKLPLSMVVILYSLSFVLFYFISFLIVLVIFNNEKIAWVILLFNILLVRHSFFWIQCEFVQGAVFTLLFFAMTEFVLKKESIPIWYFIWTPFFLITILYFYPLLLFIVLFGTLFLISLYPKQIRILSLLMGVYVLLFEIKKNYFSNWYDESNLEGIKNFKIFFPNYLDLVSFKQSVHFFLYDYYLFVILYLFSNVLFLYWKKYFYFGLMNAFVLGVYFLINVHYAQGFEQMYIESQFLILSIFISFPFIYFLIEKRWTYLLHLLITCVVVISLFQIVNIKKIYTKRLEYVRALSESSQEKRIIPISQLNTTLLKYYWGIAYEVWLLSTLETNQTHHIVCEETSNQFEEERYNKKIFLTNTKNQNYLIIPNLYFSKDTTTHYDVY